ncbi:GNAT family N-acetyltransferase [Yoonia sp. 208BN28-4]|uniref:GNAT family N-acetyltransferase n=1 Tax=Yoonia sp. 208BN28-4 TaxID=3126505 RepID=UPI0030B343CD
MTNAHFTQHLSLARPQPQDAPDLFAIMGNTATMEHAKSHGSGSETSRMVAQNAAQCSSVGYAPWVIRLTHDDRIVGYGGLLGETGNPDAGAQLLFHFRPGENSDIYAVELAEFALHRADHVLGLPTVTALAHPLDRARHDVLKQVGFASAEFVPALQRYRYIRRAGDVRQSATAPTSQ